MINVTKEEIKKIFNNYMTMNCHDIEEYINSIAYEKSCNRSTIKNRIEKYAETLGEKEYNKYLARKEEIKIKKYIYINIVEELLKKLAHKEIIDYSSYNSGYHLNEMIERYRKNYPQKGQELDKLLENIKEYYSKGNVSYNHIFSLNNLPESSKYINEIKDILNCKTDGEAITYMRNLQFTQEYFDKILASFKEKYINYEEYEEELRTKFEKYKEFVHLDKQDNKKVQEMLDIQKEQYDYSLQIVSDLINSNYSIEEYCHHNLNIDLKDIEQCINIVCYNKRNNISGLKKKLENRNNKFILELRKIVDNMSTIENYNLFDYYMDTKLSMKDFEKLTKKYNLLTPVVRSFLNSNKNVFMGYTAYKINKEVELKCNRIIKGRLVTPDEKIQIFDFLDINQIPLNSITYKTALNRYLNGTIDITKKGYTKKI